LVFNVVQNLAGIDAVPLIIYRFHYFARRLENLIYAPKIGVLWGFDPLT